MRNKTVLLVAMQWGYGDRTRGPSLEKLCFFESLKQLVERVDTFWIDELLLDKPLLQKRIKEKAQEIKPDLIMFFPYIDEFSFDTLDYLKERYTTFAWYGDDQWRFSDYSSRYAPHFSHISTTDPFSLRNYLDLGISAHLTQWAAHPFSEQIGPMCVDEAYEFDVSFVGAFNEFRRWFIQRLEKAGIRVECFGHGWPNGSVSFERMEQIFRKTKINLNISNSVSTDIRFILSSPRNFYRFCRGQKRFEQIKARNFEIPLAGGFQLSNYVLGLERYLTVGEEIAVYCTPEDAIRQIHYYLNYSDERFAITARSHARTKKEHTYLHRLKGILDFIWK